MNLTRLAVIMGVVLFFTTAETRSEWRAADSSQTIFSSADVPDLARIALIGGISAGVFTYTNIILSKAWWRDYPAPFHVNTDEDYRYALNADKFGHFYTPYLLTLAYSGAFRWAGLDEQTGLYLGAGIGTAFQLYSEIRDGFSRYGFSWGDCAANFAGAAFPLLQYHYPALRSFIPKISFEASEKVRRGEYSVIIDDYESTYNWLSLSVYDFLPASIQQWYPRWLNVAIGHSVKGLDKQGAGWHELYVGLDWNIAALPDCGWFCNLLKSLFAVYRLPAPAVKILPDVVWYGIKL